MNAPAGDEWDALIRIIRASTMFTAPDRLSFSTKGFFDRRAWDVLLRADDAVLLSSRGTSDNDALVVVAKSEFEVVTRPPAFSGSSLAATFRIGNRTYKGKISPDALDRFHRWKRA